MQITIDTIGYLAATLTTSSFLPQALQTIRSGDTKALSLGMYSLFTAGVSLWLVYGMLLENKAIIWANAITLCLALLILSYKVFNMLRRRE